MAAGLVVRHDHGSLYISDHFRAELRSLGIESSPSFLGAPEGNGIAERFLRTLKEQCLWVTDFETVEDLRRELLAFKDRYHEHWMLGRHGYLSPAEVRRRHERAALPAA